MGTVMARTLEGDINRVLEGRWGLLVTVVALVVTVGAVLAELVLVF
jgi:hypothetical protein